MATVTFVKRSVLPAAIKGKVGTSQITVAGNGQLILSSVASKLLNGAEKIVMAFMGMKVFLFLPDAPMVVKGKIEDKDMIKLNHSKKGGTYSFSGSAILKQMTEFGATATYDYKASGNQNFPVTFDEKNKALMFELPEGSLTPKPVVARAKKPKVAPAVSAEVGSISGTPVGMPPVNVQPELELDVQ
jgi:hypothetical protein